MGQFLGMLVVLTVLVIGIGVLVALILGSG
jgi:hypothetical protein